MESAPWRLKGGKTVINRFLEARRKAERETKVWIRRSLCYTYACLELDMFKGGTFTKVCASKLHDDTDGPSTSSGKATFRSEKNIRASCQNVLVLSALVYQDNNILTRQKIFVACSSPLDDWHHEQSVKCRSVGDTRQFLVSQLANRDLFKCMFDVLGRLANHTAMAYVGFTVPEEVSLSCVHAHMHSCDAHIVLLV